ncbi:MAG: M15 family metallopeptidase, partial [Clostridiales bacterium]|nr:M15 family metallopeptidase [Clostridiales bacterium]
MTKKEKKKDPISSLLKMIIVFAVLAVVLYGISYAINTAQKMALQQQQKATQERNTQAEKNYQAAMVEYNSATASDEGGTWKAPDNNQGWLVLDVSEYPVIGEKQTFDRNSILMTSPLMLTNRWHELPSDYEGAIGVRLSSLMLDTENRVPSSGVDLQLLPEVSEALDQLITQAGAQDPPLLYYNIQQGFRPYSRQQELYDEKTAQVSEKQKLEGVALEEAVLKDVNKPGTSEFQQGMRSKFLYTAPIKQRKKPLQEIFKPRHREFGLHKTVGRKALCSASLPK